LIPVWWLAIKNISLKIPQQISPSPIIIDMIKKYLLSNCLVKFKEFIMFKNRLTLAAVMIFVLVTGLACFCSVPDGLTSIFEDLTGEVVETPLLELVEETLEAPIEEPTAEPTEEPVAEPTAEPTLEVIEETPPATTGEFEDLILLDNSLWVQEEDKVYIYVILENPNSDVIFEDVEIFFTLFDAAGEEIESNSSYVRSIFPGQGFGGVQTIYLDDENSTVDSVLVEWGDLETSEPNARSNPLTVDSAQFWENNDSPIVTGAIRNNDAETYTEVRANILCYSSTGEIVGGGFSWLSFIPGLDALGFSIYVDTFDDVASVEVFPSLTYLTEVYDASELGSKVSILDDQFVIGDFRSILGGVLIQNETDSVLQNTVIHVTIFDDTDRVITTGVQYIDILFPGDDLGVPPWISSAPSGAETDNFSYEITVLPGEEIDDYELMENPFVINSATITGDFDNYVAVNFTNNYSKQISEVDIYVLLYNADGQIIGGGYDWATDPMPAGGTTDIEFWVEYVSDETVDKIDVWVLTNTWTEFE
jgi:hypothetical protein